MAHLPFLLTWHRPALAVGLLLAAACGDSSGDGTTSATEGSGAGSPSSGPNGSTGPSAGGGDAQTTTTTQSGPTSGTGGAATTGSASTTTSTASSTSSGPCEPDCAGRVCGDDGCEGSCGTCEEPMVCSSDGACIVVDPGSMSFFVSGVGNLSGNFGGVDGADDFCQGLAEAVSAGDRTWRAYVSTASEDARDRIGSGPWFDATGAEVASSVDDLHQSGLFHQNALDESGGAVPNGKTNPGMNEHDVLTGSNPDGTFSGASCQDWTSASPDDGATTGHCDASFTASGGSDPTDPSDNWNSAHVTSGCDQSGLDGTGSTARLYCFAE